MINVHVEHGIICISNCNQNTLQLLDDYKLDEDSQDNLVWSLSLPQGLLEDVH